LDQGHILNQFEDLIDLPDPEVDLARAALLLAASEYPDISIEHDLFMLERLAGDVSSRLLEEDDPLFCMNTLSQHLFDDVGFQGNTRDYYSPRNSYLNQVLERKLGIPITLSLVYVEVGKRLDIPLVGVGLPGHFLVRHRDVADLFVDPFNRGILLSEDECRQRVVEAVGGPFRWDPAYLEPVTGRDFIARIIRNLKAIYLQQRDHRRVLTVIDFALALDPNSASDRRDRGIAHYHLGNRAQALDDLQFYLDFATPAPDKDGVNQMVSHIRTILDD
jgi:regulator of sirC expression with transglutaminase-like and TPR domain